MTLLETDEPMHVSYDDMHQIFVLIKQDCARMLFQWLGVKNAPIQPEEIVGVAIEKQRRP